MNRSLRLPLGYRCQNDHSSYLDTPGKISYQPHVYSMLGYLARRSGAKRIIDIGCGSATKLRSLHEEFELVCIDQSAPLDYARKTVPSAVFISWDLESGLPNLPETLFDDSLVVCADVLEHLRNPEPLARALALLQGRCRYLLISTPDRDRARGLLDDGPPGNPAHVCEWSAGEFGRFLRDCGFPTQLLIGHTINSDWQEAKTTTLVIAGHEASWPSSRRSVRVAAVINVFNEQDILPEVVTHLVNQGVEVHLVDNWSTDGSFELGQSLQQQGLCRKVFRFPEVPTSEYEWARLLEHSERYAASLNVDWVMHHDADEIRYSPWHGTTLAEAFAHIDQLGYNAVDFTVIDFRFVSASRNSSPPYQDSLNRFEFGRRPGHFLQIKAWKSTKGAVVLAASGGHEACFSQRRVFPLKFLMKHYPLRTEAQAKRKVFKERLPRIKTEQQQRGWHTHYEDFVRLGDVPGWKAHELCPWHTRLFESEYLVERLSGIGIVE
jgi:hypothetical protein